MSSTAAVESRRVTLAEVEAVVGAWCAQLDPATLTGTQAAEVVERLAVVGRRVAAKQAGVAARVAQCRAHVGQTRTAEEFLARRNGSTRGAARKALDTARRMPSCPATAAAFEAGDLSVEEAEVISAAVVLDPSAEGRLVKTATSTHDLGEVRDAAERVKRAALAGEDPAARRARLRAARRCREWAADGMVDLGARFVGQEWVAFVGVLDAFTDAQFQAARADGRREPYEAYRADALLAVLAVAGAAVGLDLPQLHGPPARPGELVPVDPRRTERGGFDAPTPTDRLGPASLDPTTPDRVGVVDQGGATEVASPVDVVDESLATVQAVVGAVPNKINWNVTVLVDGIALRRGHVRGEEICEIPGIGPVDVDWVQGLLPEAIVDVLVHDLHDIRAYGTLTRHKPRAVKAALAARDRRCVVPGCRRLRRCQVDHRHDHAKGGPTTTDNTELLCEVHHAEKTHRGARLERTATEWLWYPPPPAPGEPRHPPDSIPWRAPLGAHLPAWDLDHHHPDARSSEPPPTSADRTGHGTLPFD